MAEAMNRLFQGSSPVSARGPLHFAFVACNRNAARFREDPSFIYRCENLAAALAAAGHRTSLLHLSAFPWRERVDVALFHRPRLNLRLRAALFLLRRRDGVAVADLDDLVCDEALSRFNPGVLNGQVPERAIRRLYAAHRRALARFDHLTVSTEPLAEEVRSRFPAARVEILPNAVHRSWRNGQEPAPSAEKDRVITYFPGTRSHDRDFAVYADGVARFLAAHPAARLEVTGPLRFDLPARPGQVVRHEKVPFPRFAERVRGAWVNLAPLEATPFTRCKSALKVLEAGFWGAPTICSPLPDAERFAFAGAIQASDGQACFEALQSLLEPARYAAATRGLPARVLAQADVGRVAEAFLQFVGAKPGGGR
jgi:hypothetical protein